MAKRRGIGYLVRRRWFLTWLSMTALSVLMMVIITVLGNQTVLPAALFYGAAAAPLAFAVATHTRTGMATSVPPAVLLGTFLFGGGIAVAFGGTFNQVLNITQGERIWGVGFIEEMAKLLPVLGIGLTGRYLSKRAGVALGFASAMGFAIMESMAYGFDELTDGIAPAELEIIGRGFTEPFTHLAWTGLICAVVFGTWEKLGKVALTFSMLGAYLLAALLHSANDAGLFLIDTAGPGMVVLFLVTAVVSYLCFRSATRSLTVPGRPEPPGPGSTTTASTGSDASVPQPRGSEPERSQQES